MDIGLLLIAASAVVYVLFILGIGNLPNHMIGYRTRRSRKNPDSWKLAQNIFFPLSIFLLALILFIHQKGIFSDRWYNIFCLLTYVLAAVITEYILYRREQHRFSL